MHVDPQPPVPEMPDLKRLTWLVDQGQFGPAEAALMAELTARLGSAHEQLQRLQRTLQRQRVLQEHQNGD